MRARAILAACGLMLAAGAVAGTAHAGPGPAILGIEPCVEHHPITPAEASGTPVAGNDAQAVSQVGVAVATDLPPGTTVTEQLSGPDRSLSLMGPVAEDHTFFGRFGIDRYGDYAISVSAPPAMASTTYTVTATEHPCTSAISAAQTLAAQQPSSSAQPVPTTTSRPIANTPATAVSAALPLWLWIGLIVIGILLLVGGFLLVRPWAPIGGTPHTVERPPVAPGDAGGGPPLVGPPPTITRSVCDWAVYYDAGGVKIALRTANGHECCRYVIRVESALVGDFQTQGRQGPDHAGDWSGEHGERFRIPDLGARWDGLESWSWAGSRSGPSGTLNWMQGFGELPHGMAPPGPATLPAPGDAQPASVSPALVAGPPYHEPPDVLAQAAFFEETLVRVRLENHCKEHRNVYAGLAESNVAVEATDECTNTAAPPCPVKLTAAGLIAARVTGDLNYSAKRVVRKLADVDRPEWLTEGPEVPHGLGGGDPLSSFGASLDGSHDHRNPPRRAHWSQITGRQGRNILADTFRVRLSDYAELYGAVVVPVEVWPTTARVSAAIWTHTRHTLRLTATDTVQCDGTCCGGDNTCRCAPSFDLMLGPGKGLIRTDGKEFNLERAHGQTPDGSYDYWDVSDR